MATPPSSKAASPDRSLLWTLLCLLGVLLALFSRSFDESQVLFSSDGPLGANSAAAAAVPAGYTGMWQDLNWVGGRMGTAFPSLTYLLLWTLKPLGFAKFYAPITLLVLGLSVWLCFRQLGFRPAVCVLGGIAGGLNGGYLSYACWGLGTLPLTIATTFLAVAAWVTPATERRWLKSALAGLAVGMGVMEGFDSGAIMSLYFATFAVYQVFQTEKPALWAALTALARMAIVVVLAAVIAAQALTVLIGTQIQGVVGMQQDEKTKTERWDEATRWSLPKIETLRVIVPGIFGYRMDTPEGGQYWGGVGQAPGIITSRHSGSGVYAGIAVVLLAGFAVAQALRGAKGPMSETERRMVWFWTGAAVVSLLLAWGRHAPFYQFFYALPYFSTIRNPVKFMHPCHFSLLILFGYGLNGLWRQYAEREVSAPGGQSQFKAWWSKATDFERHWTWGMAGAVVAGVLGWLLYASSRREVEEYLLRAVAVPAPGNPESLAQCTAAARSIVGFSLTEVAWALFFLILAGLVVLFVLNGFLAGRRARWAGIILGLLLISDFTRANTPWVYYWNYHEKYASNGLWEQLRQRPYEGRVAVLPLRLNEQMDMVQQIYHGEWIQHQMQYYNIQSLDVTQEPRTAAENAAYRKAFQSQGAAGYLRMWELTNTRLLFGLAGGLADALNQQLDPERKRFRTLIPFTLARDRQDGPILIQTNTNGPLAVLELTDTLPRASLYANWETTTNDEQVLATLANPKFDAKSKVFVDGTSPGTSTNTAPLSGGTVEFVSYAPKRIELKAVASAPSVLLLNDKHDPNWTVTVDGQPQPLLRCNFLMRGVQVPVGTHTVVFSFRLPHTALYVSLGGIGLGVILLGLVTMDARRSKAQPTEPSAKPEERRSEAKKA